MGQRKNYKEIRIYLELKENEKNIPKFMANSDQV